MRRDVISIQKTLRRGHKFMAALLTPRNKMDTKRHVVAHRALIHC